MRQSSSPADGRPGIPSFSPDLVLGMTLRPFDPKLFQPILSSLLRMVLRRPPDVLERMEPYADAVICIDPIEMPFVILFHPHPDHPGLRVCRRAEATTVSATVRSSLTTLIALAEGRVDGDALFFSRRLVIEGDTAVVVAFRNAIDGAGLDLIEIVTSALGPLRRPVRTVAQKTLGLLGRIRDDVDGLFQALLAPLRQEIDTQSFRLSEIETQVAEVAKLVHSKSRGHAA